MFTQFIDRAIVQCVTFMSHSGFKVRCSHLLFVRYGVIAKLIFLGFVTLGCPLVYHITRSGQTLTISLTAVLSKDMAIKNANQMIFQYTNFSHKFTILSNITRFQ